MYLVRLKRLARSSGPLNLSIVSASDFHVNLVVHELRRILRLLLSHHDLAQAVVHLVLGCLLQLLRRLSQESQRDLDAFLSQPELLFSFAATSWHCVQKQTKKWHEINAKRTL